MADFNLWMGRVMLNYGLELRDGWWQPRPEGAPPPQGEPLAREIWSWASCGNSFAPSWDNLNEKTKAEIRAAVALPTAERLKTLWLTHEEMQARAKPKG
jgi:hypothetical protein